MLQRELNKYLYIYIYYMKELNDDVTMMAPGLNIASCLYMRGHDILIVPLLPKLILINIHLILIHSTRVFLQTCVAQLITWFYRVWSSNHKETFS